MIYVKMTNSNKSNTLVSFVILAYNQKEYIVEAIESALLQNYSPMELIISDDCSSDGTYEVARKFVSEYNGPHQVIVVKNRENLGLAENINASVALANGEIICWAGGDDVSLPGKIEAFVDVLKSDPSLMGVHSYVNEIDMNGAFVGLRRPAVPKLIRSPEQAICGAIEVISQSHAFRKSVFAKFGPLGSEVTNESAIMAFRESCLGGIYLIEKPLTRYRIGVGVSTSRGRTVEELSIGEPLKYANWWFSAYRQIADDAKKHSINAGLEKIINRRLSYYRAIYEINLIPFNFGALFTSIYSGGFLAGFKAFVRRNAPKPLLRSIYRQRGWL